MDNRELNKAELNKNLQDILEDESVIPEDKDPVSVEKVPPVPVEKAPKIDYKAKYSASTREATALHFKNKKITDTIDAANNLPEPSLADLTAYSKDQGAEYGDLDTFSQNILRKTFINERRFGMIQDISVANKRLDDWAREVGEFVNSPEVLAKYPSMGDHDVAFRKYCMKEQRRNMDMSDLVASFLFNVQEDTSPVVKKKKPLLLKSSGGRKSAPKVRKLTAEDVRQIRDRDPRKYKRLVKSGKIGLDLLELD